jgi:hypothetical protein
VYAMTDMTVEAERLAGIAELAVFLDVRPTTVSTWYQRQERTGFPEPVAILAMGPVWDRDQVVEWWRNWKPLRNMPKVGSLPTDREKATA